MLRISVWFLNCIAMQFALLFATSCISGHEVSPLESSGYVRPANMPTCASSHVVDQYGDFLTINMHGIRQVFRWIPPGKLVLHKSPFLPDDGLRDDGKRDLVNEHGFWMADSECTQELWAKIMGEKPLYEGSTHPGFGSKLPIRKIEVEEIMKFLERAQAEIKCGQIRLPTETEWEFACRSGTTGIYAGDLDEMAWYEKRGDFLQAISRTSTYVQPVKSKKPNKWGLFDMHGNANEKCLGIKPLLMSGCIGDVTSAVLKQTPQFVCRGGDWMSEARWCRSDARNVATIVDGFRFILTVEGRIDDPVSAGLKLRDTTNAPSSGEAGSQEAGSDRVAP